MHRCLVAENHAWLLLAISSVITLPVAHIYHLGECGRLPQALRYIIIIIIIIIITLQLIAEGLLQRL